MPPDDYTPGQTDYAGDEPEFGDELVDFSTEEIDLTQQEPRCACLLLLDTSGSMAGGPIDELNKGIQVFRDELLQDELAALRVEPAILTFGSDIQVVQDFGTVGTFNPPTLVAKGATRMGAAILQGIEMVEKRKEIYRKHVLEYYRPWIFLITDGAPTDSWEEAARQVHQGEEDKHFLFWAVGTAGANFSILRQISPRPPVQLRETRFRELFKWLSNSLGTVAGSGDDVEKVTLSPIDEWGTAATR